VNTGLQAPWNFDANNGGFTSGIVINSTTTLAPLPANWGEDFNYNNTLDSGEDRDPVNGILNQNWSTAGGCGWVTMATGATTGGVWHTGTIYGTTELTCMVDGLALGQCQRHEIFPASAAGGRFWWENLQTPIVTKVNQGTYGDGRPVYRTQFTNWAWNMEIDMPDSWTRLSWEFDRNADALRPVTLNGDNVRFNSMLGPFGAIQGGNWPLFNGYPQFTGYLDSVSQNGVLGGNREGKNSCFFEQAGDAGRWIPPVFPQPVDDDLRNGWCNNPSNTRDKQTSCTSADQATVCLPPTYDGTCNFDITTSTDLFVKKNGPLRNMDMRAVNGFIEGRYFTFEDGQGEDGIRYQGAVGYMVNESNTTVGPQVKGYGVAIDDMVMEWKEVRLDEDTTTTCTTGSCATIDISATQSYNSLGKVTITVTDYSPGTPPARNNDCDHNGVYTDPGDSQDCDGNGVRDVYVNAWSDAEPTGEWVALNETATGSLVFRGNLPVSSAYDSPGTLFVRREGTVQPVISMQYMDPDDGNGNPCQQNVAAGPDPSSWGQIQAFVTLNVSTGRVVVKSSRIAGGGDGDSFADTNETVNMYITVSNKTGKNLTNLVARLATNSPYVDCIIQPVIALSSLAANAVAEIPTPFVWKVTSAASRATVFDELSASFNVVLSADQFDAAESAQTVVQDLDLNATGGGTSSTLVEGFEGADFGIFTSMSSTRPTPETRTRHRSTPRSWPTTPGASTTTRTT